MAWHDSWKNMKKKPATPQPNRRPAGGRVKDDAAKKEKEGTDADLHRK